MQDYELPQESPPPSDYSANPSLDEFVKHVRGVADEQGLIFDDRHMERGIIVVGKHVDGRRPTILIVGLKREGEDMKLVHNLTTSGLDDAEADDMRDRFLRALQSAR